jgi:hypothetical protein
VRAELSHLTGPDLVFVVATLRVREGARGATADG